MRLRSDEQLVALVRSGHEEAFQAIYDRYRQRLFAYVRQMLPMRQDAEDALQEVFERAYASLRAGERDLALRPWLYRIAHNRCIDHLRRPAPPPPEVLLALGLAPRDPVIEADCRESLRRLLCDVRRLPDQQRSALLMRELGGISYADVAQALGVTVPAVKSLLVRARVSLAAAGEARDAACAEIRAELVTAHEGRVRPNSIARRHLRDCPGCREFRGRLRGVRRTLLAAAPGLGPVGVLARILHGGSTGGAAGGGAAAACSGAGASSLTGGGIVASAGAVVAGAGHVATLLAATVVTAGGAAAISHAHPAAAHRAHPHPARAAHRAATPSSVAAAGLSATPPPAASGATGATGSAPAAVVHAAARVSVPSTPASADQVPAANDNSLGPIPDPLAPSSPSTTTPPPAADGATGAATDPAAGTPTGQPTTAPPVTGPATNPTPGTPTPLTPTPTGSGGSNPPAGGTPVPVAPTPTGAGGSTSPPPSSTGEPVPSGSAS